MINEESSQGQQAQMMPIDWVVPQGIITRYATNFVVQGTANEIFISFFEAVPPLIFGTMPPNISVQAECVGRIAVAPERLPEFIGILQDAVNRYKQQKGQGA